MEKTYDAAAIEPRVADRWEAADAFRAGAGAKPGRSVLHRHPPPPNVTAPCISATR